VPCRGKKNVVVEMKEGRNPSLRQARWWGGGGCGGKKKRGKMKHCFKGN
jgi:hypothetical protein